MNRYTRLTPAKYNPRSMQEMMMLPMMQRQKHDQSIASAVAMGDIDSQAANVDKPTIDRVKGEYEGSINDYIEKLNQDGFNHESTQGIIDLSKKKKDLTEKYLDPAAKNLAGMQKLQKDIMDSKLNGGWSPDKAQAFAAKQIQQFQGTFNEDGTTNSFQGKMLPTFVNASERIDDAIENIGEDTKQSLMESYGTHNFHELMVSTKIDGKDKMKILSMVGLELQSDSQFLNSYRTETEIGGLNEFDSKGNLKIGQFKEDGTFAPESRLGVLLYAKAMGASSQKQTNTFSNISDGLGLYKAKQQLDLESQPGKAYTSLPIEREQIRNKSFYESITNIAEGKHLSGDRPLAPKSDSQAAQKDYLDQYKRYEETGGKGEAYGIKHMSKEEQTRYNDLFEKLKEKGNIPNGVDINSKEAAVGIKNYLSKYESLTHSNTLIRPNQAKPGSLDQALLYDTDIANASKMLTQDIRSKLVQVWDEEGNPVDMEELYSTLEDEKLDYLGVMSPNNHIDAFKESGSSQTIMPHMVGIGGTRYYVGRQSSEMRTPEYAAASVIKQATYEGGRQPGLRIDHDADNPVLRNSGINGLETVFNPDTNSYNIKVKFENGKTWYPEQGEVDTQKFNEIIYGLYDDDLTNDAWK